MSNLNQAALLLSGMANNSSKPVRDKARLITDILKQTYTQQERVLVAMVDSGTITEQQAQQLLDCLLGERGATVIKRDFLITCC